MQNLRLGLIGTGFMGKAHALAFRNVKAVMGDVPDVSLHCLCEVPLVKAQEMAGQFGFLHASDNWQSMVQDPAIDIVSITAPNGLHHEMALAAIAAGKHVYCEKPLAITLEQAEEMTTAATAAGVVTMVGYNYIKNPAFDHACRLISQGAIGTPVHFRGWVDEDYQADPALPWTWRAQKSKAGLGTLGDLGCHLVSMALGLMGPIESLIADTQIIHKSRPLEDKSGHAAVENEDTASAIVRFSSGAQGSLCSSRSAWGRKNKLDWEVHGTEGMITFSQERLNELQLFQNKGPQAEQGFKTILSGPAHPPYAAFCPAPGHQLGFSDLKIIETAAFLCAVAGGPAAFPGFSDALKFEQVIHAIDQASETGSRITL